MKRTIGVYGAAGCGKGIIPLLREAHEHDPETKLVFVDDQLAPDRVNGLDVLDWPGFLNVDAELRYFCIAIANSRVREILSARYDDINIPLIEARAASVEQMDAVAIEGGACLSPFLSLTSNISISLCFRMSRFF